MHARAGVIILCLVLFLLPNICTTIKNIFLFGARDPLVFGFRRTYILKTKDLFDGGRVILFLLDICYSMLWWWNEQSKQFGFRVPFDKSEGFYFIFLRLDLMIFKSGAYYWKQKSNLTKFGKKLRLTRKYDFGYPICHTSTHYLSSMYIVVSGWNVCLRGTMLLIIFITCKFLLNC